MQQGNLKFHFSVFLCLSYFCARKGDFSPFPFCLHVLQFLYVGLTTHFAVFLVTPSRLPKGHSLENAGKQVPLCSFFLLQLLLGASAWRVLLPGLLSPGSLQLSPRSPFLRTNSHLSHSPFRSLPHITKPWAPSLSTALLRKCLRQPRGQDQPAVIRARYMRWPLFLEEYHTACGSVRVPVQQHWEHKYPMLSLAVILRAPSPTIAKAQTRQSCQIPCDVAPGDTATNIAYTYPTRLCAANTRDGS